MNSNTKILTVSYGTFSCTLEGFDDSFETMKAIAEYFRDLAADDRYFGAEPPQPDADMLARIAEREMARRVEAREHKGRVLLRAGKDPSTSAERAVATGTASNADRGNGSPDTHRMQSAHSRLEAEDLQQTHAPRRAAALGDTELEASASAFFAQSATSPLPEDAQEDLDVAGATSGLESQRPAPDAPPLAPRDTSESLALKLARIRAVVSRQDLPETDDEDEGDPTGQQAGALIRQEADGPPERKAPTVPNQDADTARETAARSIEDALADDAAVEQAVEPDDDELDAVLARLDADAKAQPEASRATAPQRAEPDAETEAAETAPGPKTVGSTGMVAARLLKVDRATLEAALEQGELYEIPTQDRAKNGGPASARTHLPEIDREAEGDVSRLMVEADEQMAEPEGATRRSTFAHLRAAVAARFADRTISRDQQEKAEENTRVFKSDLAQVVKPESPLPEAQETTPGAHRLAPFKLVQAHRVDLDDDEENDAEPRRVEAPSEEDLANETDTGFHLYADQVGARDLSDLLEAAAAHLTFVECQLEFSRSQLMARVRQAEAEDFTREDGLRCFGKLLRSGKIEKIRGGRFTASPNIGFRGKEREAG